MTHKQGTGSEVRQGRVLDILISGASFAGLATAWWMQQLGHNVTVVEIAPGLRKGGTPVDIREGVIPVVERMGLLPQIRACSLPPRGTQFLDSQGIPLIHDDSPSEPGQEEEEEGWEIERDTLLDLLFDRVRDDVEFLFGDNVIEIEETADGLEVSLASGTKRRFSLLLGCDGTHSAVRKMCFGEESQFLLSLHKCFSLTILDKLLLEENTSQMYSIPGKTVMLNAYNGKTDIGFCFHAEEEVAYDRRNRDQQKQMILDHFKDGGWRVPELLQEMTASDNFYFDQLCQIRMGAWTKGRIALVGDAGYCPSPAAGMGGSMALLGAAALADALQRYPGDLQRAFQAYDESLRPEVEQIQQGAIEFGLRMFLPETEEAIQERNAQLQLRAAEPVA